MDPDIEATLLSASVEAVNNKNNRMGGLLVDWITIHHSKINMDKLTKYVFSLSEKTHKLVKIFWCANAQRLLAKDQRFKRLAASYTGQRVHFADSVFKFPGQKKLTKMFIKTRGEDKRFKGTCIRLFKGYFVERVGQIHPESLMVKTHLPYRYRVMMGPSYRADLWAILTRQPNLSAYALGKKVHCSYRTAYIVKKSHTLLKNSLDMDFVKGFWRSKKNIKSI